MPTTIQWTGATDGDASDPTNYAPQQLPIDGDTLVFREYSVDVDEGLDAMDEVVLARLEIHRSYGGRIGLAAAPLAVGWEVAEIGLHTGSGSPAGSGRLNLHCANGGGDDPPVTIIHDTRNSGEDSFRMPVRLWISHAGAELHIRAGAVSVNDGVAESGSVELIHLAGPAARVTAGAGCTLAAYVQEAGTGLVRCGCADVAVRDGDLTIDGSAAITTLTIEGGRVMADNAPAAGAAVATANVNGGMLDGTGDGRSRTWATVNRRGGGEVAYDPAVVTITTLVAGGPVRLMKA